MMTMTLSTGKNIKASGDPLQPISINELYEMLVHPQESLANQIRQLQTMRFLDEIESLELRLHKILDIVENPNPKAGNIIFFVMYDIASNKVRRAVVKYLQRKGCHRVQRSIFLADVPGNVCQEIQNDLQAIQEMYENDDSIFVVPLSVDYIRTMKVIGHDINFDLILKTKSTMFF